MLKPLIFDFSYFSYGMKVETLVTSQSTEDSTNWEQTLKVAKTLKKTTLKQDSSKIEIEQKTYELKKNIIVHSAPKRKTI